jgi:NitT/TauT family transport system permease protein
VTPVVAIAPLILIWVGFDHINFALALLAGLIAFFPILSNTVLGLKSADFNLMDLMRLYGASRWQILWRLQFPSALPSLLTGMKIGGVIALIGEVTAEFVAGSGTATGLAWRITESGNRLEIATMFAALALLAILGIAIFAALSLLEYLLLRRWHESALKRPS